MEKQLITNNKKRLIVGMSGASGAILGIQLLEIMKKNPLWETHLVITKGIELIIASEIDYIIH